MVFTTTTTPGMAMDGIFFWTAKGLNWDAYGHNPASPPPNTSTVTAPCAPDANGYNTGAPTAINYYEWCQDHNKPLPVAPFGDVAGGGPTTLPDPNIFTNGAWYGGSPYLGPNATIRAVGSTGTTPPSGTIANSPTGEAGFAFMWHSHNEREITTSNVFPGGMLMMMLVDSRESTSIIISIPPGKTLLVVISRSLWECHINAKPASPVGEFAMVPEGGVVPVEPTARIVAFGPR